MNAKANFTAVIVAHLVGVAAAGMVWFSLIADNRFVIEIVLSVLMSSLIVQLLIYKIRPG